tara:strand:+ start:421 stop:657 length:237 start_codon:yes stop_codon:yes gene_type:complete
MRLFVSFVTEILPEEAPKLSFSEREPPSQPAQRSSLFAQELLFCRQRFTSNLEGDILALFARLSTRRGKRQSKKTLNE